MDERRTRLTSSDIQAIAALGIVFAIQAAVFLLGGSWRRALAIFVLGCGAVLPLHVYLARRKRLATAVGFCLLGLMFICLPFAMGFSSLAVAVLVPPLSSALAPWVAPDLIRMAIFVVAYLFGVLTGAGFTWAAWLKFPLRRGAA